jgi:hypothetical protein
MIEIYFDDVLIDSDYYAGITNSFKLFDEEFMLGTTASNTFNIEVPYGAVSSIPTNVKIKCNNKDYANLIVDNYELKDNNILQLKLTDKMTLLNVSYDASSIVPCTIKEILQDICSKVGVDLGTKTMINGNVVVDYYDNTLNARDYISYIAELNGGYAVIGQDGKLYLKRFNTTPVNIDMDECEDFKVGQHHVIERVVFDNGLLKYETSNDETLETLYLNSDNVYITSKEIFNNIASKILDFEFYCFETGNCKINSNVLAGDLIKFTDGVNNYQTIAQYSLDYNGDWIGGYSLQTNSKHQDETKQTGLEKKIKKLSVELDRNTAELKITAENTNTISNKLNNDVYTKSQVEELLLNAESGLTNIFTNSGGNNLLRNTAPWYMKSENTGEYWTGNLKQMVEPEAKSGFAILTQQGTLSQTIQIPTKTVNGVVEGLICSISFKYKRLVDGAEGTIKYNGRTITLGASGEIHTSGEVKQVFTLEIIANSNNGFEIYDLMMKYGEEGANGMLLWTQNANESYSETVQIGEGITAISSTTDTKATMNSDGFRVRNKTTGESVMEGTSTGGKLRDLTVTNNSRISGLIIRKSKTTGITSINGEES